MKLEQQTKGNCTGCGQQDRCQQVYEKLGHSSSPSVAGKALLAFAAPVVVFVGTGLLAQHVLGKWQLSQRLELALVFLLAASVCIGYIFVLDYIGNWLKNKALCRRHGR